MIEDYRKWYTGRLDRELEMLVFGHAGYPVILFPTSQGRYYQNKDFKLIDSVAHLIEAGRIKIYCPDSVDSESWYNYAIHPADRVKRHMQYERVILDEVAATACAETGRPRFAVAGASFGGYHAVNLAFRHPDRVGYCMSMSGAFDIKQFIYGYYDDNCYLNNPPDYLPNLTDPWFLDRMREMGIVLGTGEWDSCLEANTSLSRVLGEKGVAHWLDVRPGATHDWPLWRATFPEFLSRIG